MFESAVFFKDLTAMTSSSIFSSGPDIVQDTPFMNATEIEEDRNAKRKKSFNLFNFVSK